MQSVVEDGAISDRDAADGAVGILGILDNACVFWGQSNSFLVTEATEVLDGVAGKANLMPAVVAEPSEELNVSHGILLY